MLVCGRGLSDPVSVYRFLHTGVRLAFLLLHVDAAQRLLQAPGRVLPLSHQRLQRALEAAVVLQGLAVVQSDGVHAAVLLLDHVHLSELTQKDRQQTEGDQQAEQQEDPVNPHVWSAAGE